MTTLQSTNPTPTPVSEPRKFPAPCWTHDETLALITSYREKWYSLRRRNLRSTDWDAVAADVSLRCPPQGTAAKKTSAQCRHKMEKLRKRYRAEKGKGANGGLGFPGRVYNSSWVYFELMDAMETGGSVAAAAGVEAKGAVVAVGSKGGGFETPFGRGIPKIEGGGSAGCSLNEAVDGFLGSNRKGVVGVGGGAMKFKVKNHPGSGFDYGSNLIVHGGDEDDEEEDEEEEEDDEEEEENGGYGNGVGYGGVAGSKGFHKGFKARSNGFERKSVGGFEPRGSNGVWKRGVGSRGGVGGSGGSGGSGGVKRGADASLAAEMVASIKMLGEGFMKMEKMKMDMVREIERMRMEMEMKRSEMIVESQQMIVNAFVEGLMEKKNKKQKVKPTGEER